MGRGRDRGRGKRGEGGKKGVREGEGSRLEYATPEYLCTALQSQAMAETLVHAMLITVLATVAKL